MADLIDRERLLKELYSDIYCQNTRFLNCVRLAPAVNRWVPCSERLPEIFYYVIVAGSDGIGIARYNGALFVDDSGATYPISAITHWIPLPEPPEVK